MPLLSLQIFRDLQWLSALKVAIPSMAVVLDDGTTALLTQVHDGQYIKPRGNAGLLLIAAATLAIVAGNGPFRINIQRHFAPGIRPLSAPRRPAGILHHWIADGLMALFLPARWLGSGREWYAGQLATPAQRRLPILAAAAGMAVPAIVYLAVVGGDPGDQWLGNSCATDIAFAIGVLAILGRHAPPFHQTGHDCHR